MQGIEIHENLELGSLVENMESPELSCSLDCVGVSGDMRDDARQSTGRLDDQEIFHPFSLLPFPFCYPLEYRSKMADWLKQAMPKAMASNRDTRVIGLPVLDTVDELDSSWWRDMSARNSYCVFVPGLACTYMKRKYMYKPSYSRATLVLGRRLKHDYGHSRTKRHLQFTEMLVPVLDPHIWLRDSAQHLVSKRGSLAQRAMDVLP